MHYLNFPSHLFTKNRAQKRRTQAITALAAKAFRRYKARCQEEAFRARAIRKRLEAIRRGLALKVLRGERFLALLRWWKKTVTRAKPYKWSQPKQGPSPRDPANPNCVTVGNTARKVTWPVGSFEELKWLKNTLRKDSSVLRTKTVVHNKWDIVVTVTYKKRVTFADGLHGCVAHCAEKRTGGLPVTRKVRGWCGYDVEEKYGTAVCDRCVSSHCKCNPHKLYTCGRCETHLCCQMDHPPETCAALRLEKLEEAKHKFAKNLVSKLFPAEDRDDDAFSFFSVEPTETELDESYRALGNYLKSYLESSDELNTRTDWTDWTEMFVIQSRELVWCFTALFPRILRKEVEALVPTPDFPTTLVDPTTWLMEYTTTFVDTLSSLVPAPPAHPFSLKLSSRRTDEKETRTEALRKLNATWFANNPR